MLRRFMKRLETWYIRTFIPVHWVFHNTREPVKAIDGQILDPGWVMFRRVGLQVQYREMTASEKLDHEEINQPSSGWG